MAHVDMNTPYAEYRKEIYLANRERTFLLKIDEGTGDNLTYEDEEEGYVDYWYCEGIDSSGVEFGGGFLYEKELIAKSNMTIGQVIDYVKSRYDELDDCEMVRDLEPVGFEEGEKLYMAYEKEALKRFERIRAGIAV